MLLKNVDAALLIGGSFATKNEAHTERARRDYERALRYVNSEDNRTVDDLVDMSDSYVSELVSEVELLTENMEEAQDRIGRLANLLLYYLKKEEAFCFNAQYPAASQIEKWCSEHAIGDYEFHDFDSNNSMISFENAQDRVHFKLKFG